LAEFTIPSSCYTNDGCGITGPGWSPSGEWFAWSFRNSARRPPEDAAALVVNRTGNSNFALLDGAGSVDNLRWSPSEDKLLFQRFPTGEDSIFRYYVWNAETQATSLIFQTTNLSTLRWLPSGEYIVAYSISNEADNTMTLLSSDGEIILERQVAPLTYSGASLCLPGWSSDNRVIYLDPNLNLVVEDIVTNTRLEFDFPEDYLIGIDWSPDGDYAFIYGSDSCERVSITSQSPVWLFDNIEGELISLATSAMGVSK
jgi:WD40 repeat protein